MDRARRAAARIAAKPVEMGPGSERAIHSDPYAESDLVPAGHPDEATEPCPHCGALLHTHTKVGGSIMKCPRCGELSDAAERDSARTFWLGRETKIAAGEQPPGGPIGEEAMTTRREQEEIDRRAVVDLARKDPKVHEGELEIDDDAVVSYGMDNGAYVQAWLWVRFEGTPLDEETEDEGEMARGAAKQSGKENEDDEEDRLLNEPTCPSCHAALRVGAFVRSAECPECGEQLVRIKASFLRRISAGGQMNRVRKAARIAATPLPGDHPGWPGTPPNLADEEGWVHDEALGVERRMVGDGTLQINSLNDAGSKQIVEALKALYGRRWGETERLEDCGDGRLVWVIEDEDKSAFEQALARPAGQTATTAAHRTERRGEQMSRARKTAARIAAADPTRDAADIPARLEYLRGELRAERISYSELAELQSLSAHIDPADVELLEAAGVPEHEAARGTAARIAAEPADLARDAEYAKQQQEAKAAQDAEGEPSMKTFTIEVSGASLSDVEMAIDEVKRVISAGNTSGFNENDTGSFSFDSSGEYADSDDEEDEKDDEEENEDCPSCGASLPAVTFRRDMECPECGGSLYPDKPT